MVSESENINSLYKIVSLINNIFRKLFNILVNGGMISIQ